MRVLVKRSDTISVAAFQSVSHKISGIAQGRDRIVALDRVRRSLYFVGIEEGQGL